MKPYRAIVLVLLLGAACLLLPWGSSVTGQAVSEPQEVGIPAAAPAGAAGPLVISSQGGQRSRLGLRAEDAKLVEGLPDNLASLDVGELKRADRALESKTQGLVGSYARADDQTRQKLQTQLAEAVETHFTVRQEIREREIAELEAQVQRLRDLLEKRNQAKQTIVGTRLTQLLQAARGLGWDADLGERKKTTSAWSLQPSNVSGVRLIPSPARPAPTLLPGEPVPAAEAPPLLPSPSPGESVPAAEAPTEPEPRF